MLLPKLQLLSSHICNLLPATPHAGLARGEPSAELPGARVRRQWLMTAEEGVRLRSSLFWENGPAGVCKAVFAEPIAPKSTKLQGRVSLAFLQWIHNQTFL